MLKKPILLIIILIIGFKRFPKTVNDNNNSIPIAFSADNKYVYPLIVLLTSILFNAGPTTFYHFHIMIPYDFSKSNKLKILDLAKKIPKM